MFVFYSVAREGEQRRQSALLQPVSRFPRALMDDSSKTPQTPQKGSRAPDPMKSDVGRVDAPNENAGSPQHMFGK